MLSEPVSCTLGESSLLTVVLNEALPPVITADVPMFKRDAVYHAPLLVQVSAVTSEPCSDSA